MANKCCNVADGHKRTNETFVHINEQNKDNSITVLNENVSSGCFDTFLNMIYDINASADSLISEFERVVINSSKLFTRTRQTKSCKSGKILFDKEYTLLKRKSLNNLHI